MKLAVGDLVWAEMESMAESGSYPLEVVRVAVLIFGRIESWGDQPPPGVLVHVRVFWSALALRTTSGGIAAVPLSQIRSVWKPIEMLT